MTIQPALMGSRLVLENFSLQQSAQDAVVVRLAGELDLARDAELRACLRRLAAPDTPPRIVLDMSDVRFIDAHSIGLIIAAWRTARRHGRTLRLERLRGTPARVVGLLGLEPMLVPGAREDRPEGLVHGRHNGAAISGRPSVG